MKVCKQTRNASLNIAKCSASFRRSYPVVQLKYFLKIAAKSSSGKAFFGYPHFLWITLCATGAWQAKTQISCGSEHFAQAECSWLISRKSRA